MKKENRIKKNEEIAQIIHMRQKVKSESFFIYYRKSVDRIRIAISVSKKIGNSVERNHAKRLIREVVRPNLLKFIPMDLVIVVKNNLQDVEYRNLEEEMIRCLRRIEKRLNNE